MSGADDTGSDGGATNGNATDGASPDGTEAMTDDDKRRDQLLRLSGSTEADAAPRIEVTHREGVTRLDIADTAAVRPGPGPGAPGADDGGGF